MSTSVLPARMLEPAAVRDLNRSAEQIPAEVGTARPSPLLFEPAGYRRLAHELTEAFGGGIDVLIGAVGTGGALCGTARELRRTIPHLITCGVEPDGSTAFGGPAHAYYQSGTGTPQGAQIGALVDFDPIDQGVKAGDIEAFATCRAVARTGLLVGGSAGG
ncbi:pyridoxal-phosphate dependent enzyme [Spirillospora sp. CA-108201]